MASKANVTVVVSSSTTVTGLQQYATQLFCELKKQKHTFTTHLLQLNMPAPLFFFALRKLVPLDFPVLYQNTPWHIRLPKEGIIHLTHQGQALPLLYQKRTVIVTVHDLIPLVYPQEQGFFQRCLSRCIAAALKKSRWIIADSTQTKKDIVKHLNFSADRITIIPLGVDLSVFRQRNMKRERCTVLYVGSEMPRKNLAVLLRACALVRRKLPELKLIKIGVPQWPGAREELHALCHSLNITDAVTFIDHTDDLSTYYNTATVFVHPSLYEGFGLPVLEAMACGCPVICSDRTSLPEVAGDAAVYFNPEHVEELADKLYRLLTSPREQQRLRKAGLRHAQKFTWEKTMLATAAVYDKLLSDIKNEDR